MQNPLFGLPSARWQAENEPNEQSRLTWSKPEFSFRHQGALGVLGRPPHQVWPWKGCAEAGFAASPSGATTARAAMINEIRIELSPSGLASCNGTNT